MTLPTLATNGNNSIASSDQQPVLRLRNLSRLKQDLYVLEIALSGTSATTSIDWETLGFVGEDLEKIKATDAKLAAIPLFRHLQESASKLTQHRLAIYNRMLRVDGKMTCTVQKLPQIWSDFQTLKQMSNELRQELVGEYESGREEFFNRIHQLLSNPKFGLSTNQIADGVEKLLNKFPTPTQLEEFLQVRIGTFELIPSVESQLLAEASLIDAQARKQEAINRVQATQIVAQIQQQRAEDIERLRQEIVRSAREECQQIVAKVIEKLSKFEVGGASKRLRTGISQHIERLEALLGTDIDGTINDVFDKLTHLSNSIAQTNDSLNATGKTQLQAQIDALKASLEGEQQKLLQGTEGVGIAKATVMHMDFLT